MNGHAIAYVVIKSNLVDDQIVEFFNIWSPYMLYIHATTSGSWFSQKENKNIGGRSLISPLQKTAIFIATHVYKEILINGYN